MDVFGPTRFLADVAPAACSNVQATSVTLNGTVNPEGLDAHTIQFEYGTSTAYGSIVQATPSDAGDGSSEVPVSANASNLLPDTLYHYRLDATNSNGTNHGPDQTCTTLLVPPVVDEQPASASNITQFEATLNGTINPGNVPTAYHFLYGLTSAYGSIAPIPDLYTPIDDADHAVSQDITGLTAGTTYHYALVASSAGGTVTGPDQTFTTPPIPAPAVSTGAASAITVGAATLSGAIDAQQWSTVYHFEYGTTTSYGSDWPTVDVSLGGLSNSQPVSVYVENLQPATTYHYRLVATNGGGTTYGPDMALTTAAYPPSVIQPAPVLTASLGFFNPEANGSKPKTLTNAHKLAAALKACKKKGKSKRAKCQKAARQRFGAKKKKG